MIDIPETELLEAPPAVEVQALLAEAIACHQSWEFDKAQAMYEAILQADPGHGDANHNVGVLLAVQLLQPEAALPYFEKALAANWGQGQYWISYVDALIKAGMADAARQMIALAGSQGLHADFVRTLEQRVPMLAEPEPVRAEPEAQLVPLQASDVEMQALLPLFAEHRWADGEVMARQLTQRYPLHGFGWKALGAMLQPQGKVAQALEAKKKAAELSPDDAEAQSNLGHLLTSHGDAKAAETVLRRAVLLRPDNAEAHSNLGNALGAQGKLQQALESFSRALALNPRLAVAHNNISGIYHAKGRLDEAIAALRQALEIQPDYKNAYSNLLFALNYHPDKSASEIYEAYRGYDQQFCSAQRTHWRPHLNSCLPGQKLKIGYVSGDFRQHACSSFLQPLLAQHDKRLVHVTAYAELAAEDALTENYKAMVDRWVPTRGLDDAALAERIRDDGVDVLVDLAGHTSGNRLGVFARKPAPVSVSWLGYGYTTGVSAIDYYLTDEASTPPGCEALFAEMPWRLPQGYVYRASEGMGEVGALPALQRGYITFGSLTRSVRLNYRTIQAWSRLLLEVPGAHLVVDSKSFQDVDLCHDFVQRFGALGIAAERLHFGCHSPPWEVLRGIDIALDCFPHNSGTTLFESLYMGLPFISLAGRPSVGRLGASILQGLGRPEWIAASEEEYVQKTVALAVDIPRLALLRAGLRQEMQSSALMDEWGFARRVEAAFLQMFARWSQPQLEAKPHPDSMSAEALQAELAYNQGHAWHSQGQWALAEAHYLQALVFAPGYAEAHSNLGLVLQEQGRFSEAEACYRAAVQAKPGSAMALHNLGQAQQHRGDVAAAVQSYLQARGLDPWSEHTYSNLLFTLNYHPDKSAEEIYAVYQEYDQRFGLPYRGQWQAHGNSREEGRRLKVGYVSPDFRQHACLRFVEPLLSRHDLRAVEIYAYAELVQEDSASARYKALVDHWVPTRGLDDAALAERIRADGIDILVDLAGHTAGNRLGVFARKPAPVAISWLGYGYTTGVSAIDYYLTDEASAPVGSEALFAETPWRLPQGFIFRPAEGMGEVGPLPALQAGHITFGSLSRSVRLNERTIRLWSQVLQGVPGSRLVVDSVSFVDATAQADFVARFAACGIAAERLQIGYHSPPWDVLRGVDIALDCLPHNSGTTLFESLYMGLPFISLAGRPSVGRLGASVLTGLGREEWIAHSEEEYVQKSVDLATDLPRLAGLRAGLRQQMQASALMDEAGFARQVETAYQQMFAAWAAGVARPAGTAPQAEMDTLVQLFRQSRFKEGEALARSMVERFPENGFYWKALGVMLQPQGKRAEVLAVKQRAAQLMPQDAEAQCNLGHVLQDQGRFQEAEAVLHRAWLLKPENREVHNNLGVTYQKQARLDASLQSFRKALEISPHHAYIYSNMLFTLNYHPDKSAEEIYAVYQEYDQRFGLPYRGQWQAHGNSREEGRRLKVGYVSPDFRQHACLRFVEPLLSRHDLRAVEIYAYAELVQEDSASARYKALVDHWVPTRGLDDAALAERIRADGIDILVDLAGHTAGNRLGVFARKPAPVAISWLGYGYTTGVSAIDYYLTDEASAPVGSEALFAETPWRLPQGFIFRPAEGMGEVGPLPALQAGHITFGSLSRSVRLNERTIRLWSQVLQGVPGSRLVVDSVSFVDATAQADFVARFAACGIAAERLQIGYHSPPWDVLRGVDIALDCLPHNSGTTLFESLYMGLPFISLAGRPSVGRLGASVLTGLGREEWIAHSEEEYVQKSVDLATDLPRLAGLRAGLRQQMQASALMDEAGFARQVETAYQQMFAAWAAGVPPVQAQAELGRRQQAQVAYNLGNDRHAQGQLEAAQACYRQALDLYPALADAHSNLGLVLLEQQRLPESEACYRQALALQPSPAAHYNLGVNLKSQGRLAEAEPCFRAALALAPTLLQALFNLDRVLQELGRWTDAEVFWRSALQAQPDVAPAYVALSALLTFQRRAGEAEACLRKALDYHPSDKLLLNHLGVLLKDQRRYAEAEKIYQQALDLDPDFAVTVNNLAEVWNRAERYVEAEAGFRRAVALAPQLGMAHGNLGNVLQNQGRLHEAEASMRQAVALSPADANAFGNLLFVLNYHPDKTGAEIFAAYQEFERKFALPHRASWRPPANRRDPKRVLKVGYVSPDFRNHSCLYFMEPLLARHDKAAVRVYAYAELSREDTATARYKSYVDHWVPTRGMRDEALAQRIRDDGIDILVDLAGHTAGNRLGVFARKPAPVSLSWLGYGYTTGLSAIDYYLADAPSTPPGCESVFAEKPWRLPVGYCYRPSAANMGPVGPLPAQQRGYVTFGTLTRAVRLNHHTIRVWSEILRRVPNARLVVNSHSFGDHLTQESLAQQFAVHGITRDRLQIGYSSPAWTAQRDPAMEMDIGLDCFPHNSGTTLFESLYMGIPFVTLAGRPSMGRLGSAILAGAGHPEWVADSEQAYVENAVALAQNIPALAALRACLRQEMQASPLMDEVGFARNVEAAYRQMFTQWCETQE